MADEKAAVRKSEHFGASRYQREREREREMRGREGEREIEPKPNPNPSLSIRKGSLLGGLGFRV